MKKIIYLLLLVPILFLQSCVEEEKDIFDASASQRLTAALKEYQQILLSAPNGWVMEYYPESTQMYGGYNFLLSFNDKGEVTVASEIASPTQSETSLYRLIAETGPVLTFDTYNEIFHYLSSPSKNGKQEGYAGDYEFIFVNVTNEKIVLKGKKSGNTYIMTPLAAETKWADYLNQIAAMEELAIAPAYRMLVGEKEITLEQSGGKFYITYTVNENIEQLDIAYIFTDKGIKFYEPIELFGKTMQEFRLSEDKSALISTEDAAIKIMLVFPPLNESFSLTKEEWSVDVNNFNPTMKAWWEKTADITLEDQGEILQKMDIGYFSNKGKAGTFFGLRTDAYYASVGVDYIPTEGTTDELSFNINGKDLLNYSFYEADYQPFLDYIASNSPYKMTADDPNRPTTVTFTSKVDSNITFTASK